MVAGLNVRDNVRDNVKSTAPAATKVASSGNQRQSSSSTTPVPRYSSASCLQGSMVRQHVTGICVEWSRLELTCCTMLLLLSSVLCSDIHDTPAGVQPLHAVSSRDVEASAGVTRLPHPPLNLLEGALLTGAREEFEGNQEAYEAAASWTLQRLSGTEEGSKRRNWNSRSIPHFACADNKDTAAHGATDQQRRRPSQLVEDLLSAGSVRMVSHIRAQGLSCFVATATAEQVAVLEAAGLETLGLRNFGPFPTVLKIAPGLLQIQDGPTTARDNSGTDATTTRDRDSASRRLSVIHGEVARMDNVGGLTVELSPGVLPKRDFDVADSLIADILDGLLSPSNDLHANAYWSSSRGGLSAAEDGITIGAGSYPSASALRIREWTRAANVVRSLTSSGREEGGGAVTAGDVCSWDSIRLHHPDRDSLTVTGGLFVMDVTSDLYVFYATRGPVARLVDPTNPALRVSCLSCALS